MSDRSETVIAERNFHGVVDGSKREIRVRLFAPFADTEHWSCAYEIAWPHTDRRNVARGLDSVQALFLALQMIGGELYSARPPGIENFQWLEGDVGIGFPLPPSMRGLAIGEDRLL